MYRDKRFKHNRLQADFLSHTRGTKWDKNRGFRSVKSFQVGPDPGINVLFGRCPFRANDVCVKDDDRSGACIWFEVDVADETILLTAVAKMQCLITLIEKKDQADIGGESAVAVGIHGRRQLRLPHFLQA